jgi:hypothetical protein
MEASRLVVDKTPNGYFGVHCPSEPTLTLSPASCQVVEADDIGHPRFREGKKTFVTVNLGRHYSRSGSG